MSSRPTVWPDPRGRGTLGSSDPGVYLRFWSRDDFLPIAAALDTCLRRRDG